MVPPAREGRSSATRKGTIQFSILVALPLSLGLVVVAAA
jgi:hypothetical protein